MKNEKSDEIRQAVRKTYGEIAEADSAGCDCAPSTCCSPNDKTTAEDILVNLGY